MEDMKMDNRQNMMHLREIDLLDLLMVILLHWRSMIIVMLCGAIALGGVSYLKSNQDIQRQYEKQLAEKSVVSSKELYSEKLTYEELTNVENAFLYEQQYIAKEEYMKKSVFMQADSFHMYVSDLIYQINAIDTEHAYSITEVYQELLESGEIRNLLASTCENDVDQLISTGEENTIDLHNSNILHIQIKYPDESMCASLTHLVEEYILEKQGMIIASVGEHELKLIGDSCAEVLDYELLENQKTLKTELINIRTAEVKLTKEFSTEQQEYFNILCRENDNQEIVEETQEQTYNATIGTPSISKRYILFGAILFAFVYAGILCLKRILNNKLSIKDDLQELFGISNLGIIPKEQMKKKIFSFIDEGILNLYYPKRRKFDRVTSVELASVAVYTAAEKNNMDTVYLVGTEMCTEAIEFCKVLCIKLQENNVKGVVVENILYNAESLKKMEKAQVVVLVETAGKTMYEEICQELQLLDRQNIKILGGITVEE